MILLTSLFLLSLAANVVLVWYTRKLVENMKYGISNVEEMQRLFEEYVGLLKPLAEMENYYADPALTSAINNTELVINACRVYKKTMIENYEEENQIEQQPSSVEAGNEEKK